MIERALIATIFIIVAIYLPFFYGKLFNRIFRFSDDNRFLNWYLGFLMLILSGIISGIIFSIIYWVIYGK